MSKHSFYGRRENYQMGGMRKNYILDLISDGTETVLDIGCGNGELAGTLCTRGCRVTGVDISQNAVKEAGKFLDDSFCFDIEKESWPEELMSQKFDLVVASEIIEHIFDPDAFLNKIKFLLASEGKVIITTPNVLFWKNRVKILFGKFEYKNEGIMDFGHIRLFTLSSIKDVFKKSGLTVVRERNFYPNLYARGLNFLGDIFPGLFAYQLIFLLSHEEK